MELTDHLALFPEDRKHLYVLRDANTYFNCLQGRLSTSDAAVFCKGRAEVVVPLWPLPQTENEERRDFFVDFFVFFAFRRPYCSPEPE